jgi:hypothetical protein
VTRRFPHLGTRATALAAAAALCTPAHAVSLGAQDSTAARRPPAAPAPARPGVRLCVGGDVVLGTNLDTTWTAKAAARLRRPVPALPDPDSLLRPLRPLVRGADVVLLNVEGAIGDGDAPPKCGPASTGCFALRQPPAAAAALRRIAGEQAVVVGNLANNHARDAGVEGLAETRAHLDSAGVLVTGVDTVPTEVVTARGDTVAFLGFSTSGGDAPDARRLHAVRRHVRAAAARYRRVVVTMHVGAEGVLAQRTPDSTERYFGAPRGNARAFARAAVGAGADLVVGHGPHVVRAMEWRGRALVAYSLGNLVTYGPFSFREPLNRGVVLCATLGRDGSPTRAVLHPTRQRAPGRVAPDRARRAIALVDSLSRLDAPRTRVRVDRHGVIAERRRAPRKPAR